MAEAAGNSLRTRTKRTHTYTRLQQRAWPAQLRPPPCMGSDELDVPIYDAGVLSHEDALTGHNASNPAVIRTAPRMRSKVRALRLHRAPGCDPGYGASSDNFESGFAQDESGAETRFRFSTGGYPISCGWPRFSGHSKNKNCGVL